MHSCLHGPRLMAIHFPLDWIRAAGMESGFSLDLEGGDDHHCRYKANLSRGNLLGELHATSSIQPLFAERQFIPCADGGCARNLATSDANDRV